MVPSGMTRLHSKRTSDIGFLPFFPDYDTLVTFLYASPYIDVRAEFSMQKQNVGSRHLKYTCFKKNAIMRRGKHKSNAALKQSK